MITSVKVFLFCAGLLSLCSANSELNLSEAKKIALLEERIMESVEMDYSHYKFYPFAIQDRQQFIIQHQSQQIVKGEVQVKWIGDSSNLMQPDYDKNQHITMIILDEHLGVTVQERLFHFMTGFKFSAQPHHSYRIVFRNSGSINKMLEMTICYSEPLTHKLPNHQNATTSLENSLSLIQEISTDFEAIISRYAQKNFAGQEETQQIAMNALSYAKWVGWEICLFIVMALAQIWVMGRELNSSQYLI